MKQPWAFHPGGLWRFFLAVLPVDLALKQLFCLSSFEQVIVEKVSGSQIVDIDKRKYLVPSDITVAQFMWIIRKRIQLPSEKAIFLFVDKTVPQSR